MASSNLKIRQQCLSVRNNVNRLLGFISSISNWSQEVVLQLYSPILRFRLDYAAQLGSPYNRMDLNSLVNIHLMRNIPYKERLRSLILHSLIRRRMMGDIIKVFRWKMDISKGYNKVLGISLQERV